MASIDYETILIDLRTRDSAEIAAIKQGARDVIYGLSENISALSQSTTFARDDAAIILRACLKVESETGGETSPFDTGAPIAGHCVRRDRGYTTGCC